MSTLIRSLVIVSILVTFAALPAWAADANLPYPTFTAGQIAKASEVTANFQELETAINTNMPGVDYNNSTTYISVTSTDSTVLSQTISAPTSGYIIATFSAIAYFSHTSGTSDNIRYCINTNGANVDFRPSFRYINVPAGLPTAIYHFAAATSEVFSVTAGNHTIYVRADSSEITAGNLSLGYPYLYAIFVPARY